MRATIITQKEELANDAYEYQKQLENEVLTLKEKLHVTQIMFSPSSQGRDGADERTRGNRDYEDSLERCPPPIRRSIERLNQYASLDNQ